MQATASDMEDFARSALGGMRGAIERLDGLSRQNAALVEQSAVSGAKSAVAAMR